MPWKRQYDSHPPETAVVLSVSSSETHQIELREIFKRSEWSLHSSSKWVLHPVPNFQSAMAALQQTRIPILLFDSDLTPGSWRDLLAGPATLPDPPLVIVSSRIVDEEMWAEALNLGAYDVLAKPFNTEEVIRVLSFAWLRWKADRKSHTA